MESIIVTIQETTTPGPHKTNEQSGEESIRNCRSVPNEHCQSS